MIVIRGNAGATNLPTQQTSEPARAFGYSDHIGSPRLEWPSTCSPQLPSADGFRHWPPRIRCLSVAGCNSQPEARLRDEGKSVDELRTMLADPNPEVQARGALGLSLHGPAASPAVPGSHRSLETARTHWCVKTRPWRSVRLVRGAESAVPALSEALGDSEWAVRRQAAIALGDIGPAAKPALPALAKRDADPNKQVRDAAKGGGRRLGGEAWGIIGLAGAQAL